MFWSLVQLQAAASFIDLFWRARAFQAASIAHESGARFDNKCSSITIQQNAYPLWSFLRCLREKIPHMSPTCHWNGSIDTEREFQLFYKIITAALLSPLFWLTEGNLGPGRSDKKHVEVTLAICLLFQSRLPLLPPVLAVRFVSERYLRDFPNTGSVVVWSLSAFEH